MGVRVMGAVPLWKMGERITFVAALRHNKMVAPSGMVEGAMTGEMFFLC